MFDRLIPVARLVFGKVKHVSVFAKFQTLLRTSDLKAAPGKLFRKIKRLLAILLRHVLPQKFGNSSCVNRRERIFRRWSEGGEAVLTRLNEGPPSAQIDYLRFRQWP